MSRRGWLRLAPWWRGPLLLVRRPGVAGALVVAAVVAVVPVAAGPVFLSSAGSATLRARTAGVCPVKLGSQLTTPDLAVDDTYIRPALQTAIADEAAAAAQVPGLGPATLTLVSPMVSVDTPDGRTAVAMVGRDDLAEHVQMLAGGPGPGLWLPDRFATAHHLRPGDNLMVYRNPHIQVIDPQQQNQPNTFVDDRPVAHPPTAVPVVAIYRDLRDQPDDPFWCDISTLYRGDPAQRSGAARNDKPILNMVLADRATMLSIVAHVHLMTSLRIERAPVKAEMTTPQATRLAGDITAMHQSLHKKLSKLGNVEGTRVKYNTALPGYAHRAALVESNLRGTTLPISAAGLLVGLLVVVAAGYFWVRRRRRELVVLATFGASACWLGIKAVLEAWPALALGAVCGWGLAGFLVAQVGPSEVISGQAWVQSLLAAVAAFVVAVAVVGMAAAIACRPLVGAPPASQARRWMRAVPWELALLAGAALYWFAGGGQYMVRLGLLLGTMVQIPAKLLVVPMLAMVGLGVLGARLVVLATRRRGGVGRSSRSPVRLLYSRRLRHAVVAMATLALITAVPVALAVYGQTATGSVDATLAAQARLATGSDVVVDLDEPAAVPAQLAGQATAVQRLDHVQIAGTQASLLIIDTQSFTQAAYWDDRIDGAPLARILAALRPTSDDPTPGGSTPDGALPVVASAPIAGGAATMSLGDVSIPVRVSSVATLPAEQGGYPLIIVDRAALARVPGDAGNALTAHATPQLWVRGDPARIRTLVSDSDLRVSSFTVADDRYANTYYQPVTYTFTYLAALSLLTGVVVMVGFLLYWESRLPVLRRGFVMLRLMGLRATRQGWLLIAELTTPLIVGALAGLGLGLAADVTMRDQLNVDPAALPGTVLSIPWSLFVGLIVVVGLFAVLVAVLTHARLIRTQVGEVLRDVD